jgi:hypothetical protein
VRPIATALLALFALTPALGACGGDSEEESERPLTESAIEVPGGHADVAVIDEWIRALSEGDVEAAAELFALPTVVANGTPPIELSTRAEVVDFNASLPCGAELVGARPLDDDLIAATFRLTERPGPGECGPGVGGLARTAFLIRDGEIVQWRRLPDARLEDEPSGPVV